MILTEAHIIRKNRKTKELFRRIDNYCYQAKNLHNAVNYRIKQCSRISRKLKEERTEDGSRKFLWERKQTRTSLAFHMIV